MGPGFTSCPDQARSVPAAPVLISVAFGFATLGTLFCRQVRAPVKPPFRLWMALTGTAVGLFLVASLALSAEAFDHDIVWQVAGTAVVVAASCWTIWSYLTLGNSFSVGEDLTSDHKLRVIGPYAVVRHPVYLGWLVLTVGLAAVISWSFLVLSPLVVFGAVRQIPREETRLLRAHPADFSRYRARTPDRLIPGDRWLARRKMEGGGV